MARNAMQQAMGGSLTLLRRFASHPLVDRMGLREPAERILHEGARTGARAAVAVAKAIDDNRKRRSPTIEGSGGPSRFDLTPTEDQQLVIDTMKRFAAEAIAPIAEEADEACAPPSELLEMAGELGLCGMTVPEAFGGSATERSPITSCLIAETLAARDMGLALALLSPMGVANAIVDHGTEAQKRRWLPAFTEERFVASAIALLEPGALFSPERLSTKAKESKGGFTLSGVKSLVPLATSAERFVVVAHRVGVGPRAFVVERGLPGVSVKHDPAMGLRAAALGTLHLEDVKVDGDALLGGDGAFDYITFVDRCRIAWCALAVGCAQGVLDYVVPYCNDRIAFGEPISHKQAVAFLGADVAIELEGMRLLTWRAASRSELGKDARRETFLARLQCAEKGMWIGTTGVQLMGGAGYIKEYPMERQYRHLRAIGIMEGGLSA